MILAMKVSLSCTKIISVHECTGIGPDKLVNTFSIQTRYAASLSARTILSALFLRDAAAQAFSERFQSLCPSFCQAFFRHIHAFYQASSSLHLASTLGCGDEMQPREEMCTVCHWRMPRCSVGNKCESFLQSAQEMAGCSSTLYLSSGSVRLLTLYSIY